MSDEPTTGTTDADGPPPVLGSWRVLYGVVIGLALLSIGASALFSSWRF